MGGSFTVYVFQSCNNNLKDVFKQIVFTMPTTEESISDKQLLH